LLGRIYVIYIICICVCVSVSRYRCIYRYDIDDYNNNNVSRKEFWSVVGGGGMLWWHCYTVRTSVRRITRKILIALYIIIYYCYFFLLITFYYYSTLHGTRDDSPVRAFVSRTGQIVPYREKKHQQLRTRSFPDRGTANDRGPGVDNYIILYWSNIPRYQFRRRPNSVRTLSCTRTLILFSVRLQRLHQVINHVLIILYNWRHFCNLHNSQQRLQL